MQLRWNREKRGRGRGSIVNMLQQGWRLTGGAPEKLNMIEWRNVTIVDEGE